MGRMRNRLGVAGLLVVGTALAIGTIRCEMKYQDGKKHLATGVTMQEDIRKTSIDYNSRDHMNSIANGINTANVEEAAIVLAYKLRSIFTENDIEFSYRKLSINTDGLVITPEPRITPQMERWNIDRQNVVVAMDGILIINEGKPVRILGLKGEYVEYNVTDLLRDSEFYRELFHKKLVRHVKHLLDFDDAIDAHFRLAKETVDALPQAMRRGVLEGALYGLGLDVFYGLFLLLRYLPKYRKEKRRRELEERLRVTSHRPIVPKSVDVIPVVSQPVITVTRAIEEPLASLNGSVHNNSPKPKMPREKRIVNDRELELLLERRIIDVLSDIVKPSYVFTIADAIVTNCHGHATRTLEEALKGPENMISYLKRNGWILKHLDGIREWKVLAQDDSQDRFDKRDALA